MTATLTENGAEKRSVCEFRKLLSRELDSGYAVLIEAYEWLNARGSGQWPHPFPYEKYCRWHELGLNYGYFSNGTLTTVLSLVEEADDRWRDYLSGASVMWVRAVAGSSWQRKNGFGRLAAFEVMITTPAIQNLIRDNKTFQIPNMIQTGKASQMRLMDESIVELLEAEKISLNQAQQNIAQKKSLAKFMTEKDPEPSTES